MSGGSYEYLCYKSTDEIISNQTTLEQMANDLAKLGYAADVAAETWDIIYTLRAFETRMQVALDRMQPIWLAREWWQSGDTSEEGFKRILEEYRTRGENAT